MKLVKGTAAGARQRGSDDTISPRFSRPNQHFTRCLNLVITFKPYFDTFSSSGPGILLDHQSVIQRCEASFIFRLFDEPYFARRTGSQRSGPATLLLFSSLALFGLVCLKAITGSYIGLSDHWRHLKTAIVHHPELSYTQYQVFPLRSTCFDNTICYYLRYLALSYLAVVLLKGLKTRSAEPIFILVSALNIRQLHQGSKKVDLSVLLALLAAPQSPGQVTFRKKIVDYLSPISPISEIGSFVNMDQRHNRKRNYRSIRDRMAEDEAMTLRDAEARERAEDEELLLRNTKAGKRVNPKNLDAEGYPHEVLIASDKHVTWAPNLVGNSPSLSAQPRSQSRRRNAANDVASTGNYLADQSSFNGTPGNQVPTWGLDSGNNSPEGLNPSRISSGPHRPSLRRTRSGVFQQMPTQEDDEVPPMPSHSLLSRATSTFFHTNPGRTGHDLSVTARSVSNSESNNSSGLMYGATGLRSVRDLGMEEEARKMGFDIPQTRNRFGLPEVVTRDGTLLMESANEVLSTAGTMKGLTIPDDVHDDSDEGSALFRGFARDDISEEQDSHKICSAAVLPDTETQSGLDEPENSQPDNMSWLIDGFSPSNIDLLKDFGTPPQTETYPSQSHSDFIMADEAHNNLHHLDAPPLIGDFGTYEAEQGHAGGVDQINPDHGGGGDVTALRGEISKLVERCTAKEAEVIDLTAREKAAWERVKLLEKILDSRGVPFEDAVDLTADGCRAYQTPTKTGSSSKPKSTLGGDSSGNRSSHKRSKSQEGGFFKSFMGATEPSLVAFEKMKEKSLLEAHTNEKDPDLAVKLRVSPRQLPPEAPKPASKEPVPKSKSGGSSILGRRNGVDDLKRREAKGPGPSESNKYSARNHSQSSDSSSKNTSFVSVTGESISRSKSPEATSGPPSHRENILSVSEDLPLSASHQRHSRTSHVLTGEHGADLELALAGLHSERSQQQRRGAMPQGWEHTSVSRTGRNEDHDEPGSTREDYERFIGDRHITPASFNSSVGSLVHENQASFNRIRGNEVLRSNPPSRSAPVCPGSSTYPTESHQKVYERHEVREMESSQIKAPTTLELSNPNNSLPEINPLEFEREEAKKNDNKLSFKKLFSRK